MKYEVTITSIGDHVLQLMQMRESMILFDKDVPYQYSEMVVAHTKGILKEDLVVGDTLHIAGLDYQITAIGENALQTLREHGHFTLVFDGKETVEQPGQIAIHGAAIPRVMVGDLVQFA